MSPEKGFICMPYIFDNFCSLYSKWCRKTCEPVYRDFLSNCFIAHEKLHIFQFVVLHLSSVIDLVNFPNYRYTVRLITRAVLLLDFLLLENVAGVAQLVEQRIRNAQVGGSNPLAGTSGHGPKIWLI